MRDWTPGTRAFQGYGAQQQINSRWDWIPSPRHADLVTSCRVCPILFLVYLMWLRRLARSDSTLSCSRGIQTANSGVNVNA